MYVAGSMLLLMRGFVILYIVLYHNGNNETLIKLLLKGVHYKGSKEREKKQLELAAIHLKSL